MKGFVQNPLQFLIVKLLCTGLVIMIMSKVLEKSEYWAKIGMRTILLLMLFTVGNNLFVISGSAVDFPSFNGAVGSIGVGNGYFNDELTTFGITSNRNVYIACEVQYCTIVEPIGYSLGSSGATNLVKWDLVHNLTYGMVASDGYLYFSDTQGIKRDQLRSVTNQVNANDTGVGGNVLLIYSSANIAQFNEISGYIYFFETSTNSIKRFSLNDLVVETVYTITADATYTFTNIAYFAVVNNTLELFIVEGKATSFVIVNINSSHTSCPCHQFAQSADLFNSGGFITTPNYLIYRYNHGITFLSNEAVFYLNNFTLKSTSLTSGSWYLNNGLSLSGYSPIILYSNTATNNYSTTQFYESGSSNVNVTLPELTYTHSGVSSIYSSYGNTTPIDISYSLAFNMLPAEAYFGNLYTWTINILDPNGANIGSKTLDVFSSGCTQFEDSLFFPVYLPGLAPFNCSISGRVLFTQATINGSVLPWTPNGTWEVSLTELNTSTLSIATLATNTFTILNYSVTSPTSSTVTPPLVPAPGEGWGSPTDNNSKSHTVGIYDGWVGLLGLGVNNLTRFFFALIIIAFIMLIGALISKFNAMVMLIFGFVPFGFFSAISLDPSAVAAGIEYIPKWIIVLFILLFALAFKIFR